MHRRAMCFALALLFAPTFGVAQSPYMQLGSGGGFGAYYSSGSTDRGVFLAGALGFGLGWRRFTGAELYLLGGGGGGLFLEEGDPGGHVGAGMGLTNRGSSGLYTELRYDHLVGTFTYASRTRSLVSLIAGVRFGPKRGF